jgi:hypothetical protein
MKPKVNVDLDKDGYIIVFDDEQNLIQRTGPVPFWAELSKEQKQQEREKFFSILIRKGARRGKLVVEKRGRGKN